MASYGNLRDAYASMYEPKKDPLVEAIETLADAEVINQSEKETLLEKMSAMDFMKNKYGDALIKPNKATPDQVKAAQKKRAQNYAQNHSPGGAMYKDPYKSRAGESD